MSAAVDAHREDDGPNSLRVLPSASTDQGDKFRSRSRSIDEGMEVVLDGEGGEDRIVDTAKSAGNSSIFRAPHPVRPRAVRAHGSGGPPLSSSGSYGYPPHGPPDAYAHRAPYPVPYNPSGSFDDAGYRPGPPPSSHYSPHVHYPPKRHGEGVNVISPSHKSGPPGTPRRGGAPGHYHYPPASPVSRVAAGSSPPRAKGGYPGRRPEGPYSAAQRRPHEDSFGNPYGPPIVAESSFDSDHYGSSHHSSPGSSMPTTPNAPHYGHRPPPPEYAGSYYTGAAPSFGGGSFDSAPPPYDDYGRYGPPPGYHPESPYSHYPPYHGHHYSPASPYYDGYPSPHHHPHHPPPHHGDYYRRGMGPRMWNDDPSLMMRNKSSSTHNMELPEAAHEVDFDIVDPPPTPVTPPSSHPVCESPGEVNGFDVLLGRGGGTNSQIGNRRFRKLVQEFQPTYLLARRKEKPLLARTIVLIIRKRGGRFLKKDDETGQLFEVGDAKAEAKTSQALREGLDVRATKSAATSLAKGKKKRPSASKTKMETGDDAESPKSQSSEDSQTQDDESKDKKEPGDAPPELPKLHGEGPAPSTANTATARSGSPSDFRSKRRRVRSAERENVISDFCPPRASLGRIDNDDSSVVDEAHGSERSNQDSSTAEYQPKGCAGIALDIVTGAASGSFCLGPRQWR